MEKLVGFWCVIVAGIFLCSKCDIIVESLEDVSVLSECGIGKADIAANSSNPLMVPLTLINGAVCLDGTLPGYYLSRGFGRGQNSWLVQLEVLAIFLVFFPCDITENNYRVEGGATMSDHVLYVQRRTVARRTTSKRKLNSLGFLATNLRKIQVIADFYNWNRVKVAYCDGASFAGEGENKGAELQFRGQRIWTAAMKELMSQGMSHNADQALLTGCSAGGLASILHCDEFRDLFTSNTKVKCLSDAGLFMDAKDVSGGTALRNFFNGVVTLQGVERNCTDHLEPPSCFFPQNLIANVKAPLFILNSAYDSWQVQQSLAPPSADPKGIWSRCKVNLDQCSESQIQFLRGFRDQMLDAVKSLATSRESGYFIVSRLFHCQSEYQSRWFAAHSPTVDGKTVATSVGDWYFDRATAKAIECRCPYHICRNPC